MKTKTRKRKSLGHIKKLSTLLALALKDLRKQERAKNCEVHMAMWWAPRSRSGDTCYACLAGSVMKHSLQKPRDPRNFWGDPAAEIAPSHFDDPTNSRLLALNDLRVGEVGGAAGLMGLPTSVSDRDVANYHFNRDQWWSDMKQLLADLRAAGE